MQILLSAVVVVFNQSTLIVDEDDGQVQLALSLSFAVRINITIQVFTNNNWTASKC